MFNTFFILPTSNSTFTLYFTIDVAYLKKEYSTEFCLIDTGRASYIVKKEEEEDFSKDFEKLNEEELSLKYSQIKGNKLNWVKYLLNAGFITKDEVFKSIFDKEIDRFLENERSFSCNLELSDKEKEIMKEYMYSDIDIAKKIVISKFSELINNSDLINNLEKKDIVDKLTKRINETVVSVSLTNSKSKPEASLSNNSNSIQIAHGEKHLRMVNDGELVGFWENSDYRASNIGVIIHELGHQGGRIFGYSFSESFSVKLQAECLKELGLRMNVDKIYERSLLRKSYITYVEDFNEDDDGELNKFQRMLHYSQTKDASKYDILEDYFFKIIDIYKHEDTYEDLLLYSNRDNSQFCLNEYAEVYLDKELSLNEIFDFNLTMDHRTGDNLLVGDVLFIERYFSDDKYSDLDKLILINRYLYERETNPNIILKIKNNLQSLFGFSKEEFLKIDSEALYNYSKEIINDYKDSVANADRDTLEYTIGSLDYTISSNIIDFTNTLTFQTSKELIDLYYETTIEAIKNDLLEHTRLGIYAEEEDYEALFKSEVLEYIDQKEEELEQEIEEFRAIQSEEMISIANSVKSKKIIIEGKDGEDFYLLFNSENDEFEVFSLNNNNKMKFTIYIDAESLYEIAVASVEQSGFSDRSFVVIILKPEQKDHTITIKNIEPIVSSNQQNSTIKLKEDKKKPTNSFNQ